MYKMKFNKQLYPKIALIKAAYNFTDSAYVHLDSDESYYYVTIENKSDSNDFHEQEFNNEILAQSVRHEIYKETKDIRELVWARALSTSLIVDNGIDENEAEDINEYNENEILKNWFDNNEDNND